jgi:hypothetical protein
MEAKNVKHCLSCNEEGHHYNECNKIPFLGLLAGALGLATEPICGMSEEDIKKNINKKPKV